MEPSLPFGYSDCRRVAAVAAGDDIFVTVFSLDDICRRRLVVTRVYRAVMVSVICVTVVRLFFAATTDVR